MWQKKKKKERCKLGIASKKVKRVRIQSLYLEIELWELRIARKSQNYEMKSRNYFLFFDNRNYFFYYSVAKTKYNKAKKKTKTKPK